MKTYTVTVVREIRKAKEDAAPDDHWFYDYIRRTTEVHEKPAR